MYGSAGFVSLEPRLERLSFLSFFLRFRFGRLLLAFAAAVRDDVARPGGVPLFALSLALPRGPPAAPLLELLLLRRWRSSSTAAAARGGTSSSSLPAGGGALPGPASSSAGVARGAPEARDSLKTPPFASLQKGEEGVGRIGAHNGPEG